VALTGELQLVVGGFKALARATAAPVRASPILSRLGLDAVADPVMRGIGGGSS